MTEPKPIKKPDSSEESNDSAPQAVMATRQQRTAFKRLQPQWPEEVALEWARISALGPAQGKRQAESDLIAAVVPHSVTYAPKTHRLTMAGWQKYKSRVSSEWRSEKTTGLSRTLMLGKLGGSETLLADGRPDGVLGVVGSGRGMAGEVRAVFCG